MPRRKTKMQRPENWVQRTLQVNLRNSDEKDPTIILIQGKFSSEDDAKEYAQIYQAYLRVLQKIDGCTNLKKTTVHVRKKTAPTPRSQPAKMISYGTMVPLEILLGKPKEKQ